MAGRAGARCPWPYAAVPDVVAWRSVSAADSAATRSRTLGIAATTKHTGRSERTITSRESRDNVTASPDHVHRMIMRGLPSELPARRQPGCRVEIARAVHAARTHHELGATQILNAFRRLAVHDHEVGDFADIDASIVLVFFHHARRNDRRDLEHVRRRNPRPLINLELAVVWQSWD